ncbi:MAG: sigma 54-interacting transcriptional regulator [bacterium]
MSKADDGKAFAREWSDLIFDSITEGVFTTDEDCRITSFNRAAEAITGFHRQEAIGQYCFDVFRTDLCHTKCALRYSLESGMPVSNVRVNIMNREGVKVPISVSTSVLYDREGRSLGAVEIFRDMSALEELKKQLHEADSFEKMVSRNKEMQEIFNLIPDVAESDCNVLIQGPSGSGKELLARAIHKLSSRRDRPYIRVNCAALPEPLLESELFGYAKGAFTDAKRDKPGRFVVADRGSLLLDEIGDMPLSLQAKLLRVLQDGEIQPLGSTKTIHVDVRVVASTHYDMKKMVKEGGFREDLFYRLKVINIDIPPLRRRKEDIPILVDHFIRTFNQRQGKNIKGVSEEVLEHLLSYDFPGNVRELENAVEHAFVLCKSELIQLNHLPRDMRETETEPAEDASPKSPIEHAETRTIKELLEKNHWDKGKVADILGIHRTTLWRKMKKLGISE